MTRLDTYCKLLKDIYSERIVKLFTTRNENNLTLTMNNEANNQKEKKDYDRMDDEGCDTCKSDFRNKDINFFKRHLEFPGWIGDLDFTGTAPAKEIMIIGEAPPKLKEQINIAFGLGLYPIEHDGELNFDHLKGIYSGEETQLKAIIGHQRRKNKLWEYLNLLFLNKLDIIKPKIYITDLCKCNDDIVENNELNKNKVIWKKCLSKCLIEEIKLINPSLIIFQGWSSYTNVTSYFKLKKSDHALLFDKFPLNGKNIYFFKIYHQAYFRSENKRSNYINQNHQFIEKKVLKEILNIF